jgi:polyhydroxyalkanoate synthesis regulator phasin
MTDIGHNGGPKADGHAIHIEDLFALISDTVAGGEVTNDEQEAALDNLLNDVREARKAADADRVEEKRPHDEAGKAVQAKYKPLLDRCDMAAETIKRLLTPYRTARQAAKDAAAKQAREEAEARQQAAQDALRTPDDMQEKFAAEQDIATARKLTAVANKIDRSATGLRTSYRAEVTDYTAFARWAWAQRLDECQRFFDELAAIEGKRGPVTIPGMIVHTDRKAA